MNIIDKGLSFGSMNMNNHPVMAIVHHLEAEGPNWTVQMIHNMHIVERGWSGIGYHYYIRLDGTVFKGRPDSAIGSHCLGANSNTLGIAFEGNYDQRSEMPAAQFGAWCELKSYLCGKYGNLPVYGHREKGSSKCPGSKFPLEKVRTATQGSAVKLGWNEDSTGWWYCTDVAKKSFYKDDWKLIDGEWYSFDSQGYARESKWIQDKGDWYYLRENCMMAKSQWLWLEGDCYCFGPTGKMYYNCTTPDGYKVDETGAWIK